MRRNGRWLALICGGALLACGCSLRPFAHDPLLRSGRGVWGNRDNARRPLPQTQLEPIGPSAPANPADPRREDN